MSVVRALLLVLTGWGCTAEEGPVIDRVTPASAARGASIEVSGHRLCEAIDAAGTCAPHAGSVTFGIEPPQVAAAITNWTQTRIVVVVPGQVPVGDSEIVVTESGRSSNALGFVVLP